MFWLIFHYFHYSLTTGCGEKNYSPPFTSSPTKILPLLPNLCLAALHLELRSVTCNGAEENQAHRCDPYDLRVQEQPLFLVCSSINIFTSMGLDP